MSVKRITTAQGARASLRAAAARGEWTPAKPLSQYKPDTLIRKANAFKAQKAAGVPVSNAAARGHARAPEHPGRAPKPAPQTATGTPTPRAKPAPQPKAAPPLQGVPKVMKFTDGKITSTYSESRAERAITGAANRGNRVTVKAYSDGRWVDVFSNRGHSKGIGAEKLQQMIADHGSLADALDAAGYADLAEDGIDAYQIDELYEEFW